MMCFICNKPFTDEEWENRHTFLFENGVVHDYCCPIHKAMSNKPYAKIMAVAPELLIALEAIIEECDEPVPHMPKVKHIAQNAIAKTTPI